MNDPSVKTFQTKTWDLFNPSEEHTLLRNMIREFVEAEVEGQALESDKK